MKLNLGAGHTPLSGYKNIDRGYLTEETTAFGAPEDPWKMRGEVFPLDYVKDETCDEVRASHVLEHLPFRDTLNAIRDWVRVLKPGGVLKIAVPDFEWICRQYLAEVDTDATREPLLTAYLMGGQKDENDYHKAIFDSRGLKHGMELAGLVGVGPWEGDAGDCSGLAVSLNLQGMKPYATLLGYPVVYMDFPRIPAQAPQNVTSEPQEASEESGDAFEWLRARAYNKYSQWGEDGLLEAVFEKLGTTNRIVIECGAGHPVRGSNSRKLIEEGWRALLVELDHEKNVALHEEYAAAKNVSVYECRASGRTNYQRKERCLDAILDDYSIDSAPDLLVIDVDGQDWYLWNGLIHHRPRVVVIEFSQDVDADFIPEENGAGQAGQQAIEALAGLKGYEPVVLTGSNFICVDRNILPKLLPEGAEMPPVVLPFKAQEIACVLSVPRLGFMSNMQCLLSVANLGIQVRMQQGAFWGQCLTEAMLQFMEEDRFKYILTVDYDSIFTADDVLRLYRYMASSDGANIDALTTVQVRRENDNVLLTMADAEGNARSQVSVEEMQQDVVRVRTAHFGLTLFRVDALRRLPHPWFLDVPDADGKWGAGKLDCDISFWHKWQAAGNSLYLAPRVSIGHIEAVITWPDGWLKSMYQKMSAYQKHGKPAVAWR